MPSTEHQTLFNIILKISDKKQLERLTDQVKKFEKNIDAVEEPTIRTVTASQEFIRVISDAPYGMRGMANNLQELSVGFSRMAQDAREAGESTGYALRQMVRQLTSGPMAIPLAVAVITTLVLSMDKLKNAYDSVRVAVGNLTSAQAAYNRSARETRENFAETLVGALDEDEVYAASEAFAGVIDDQHRLLRAINSSSFTRGLLDVASFFYIPKEQREILRGVRDDLELMQDVADTLAARRGAIEERNKLLDTLRQREGFEGVSIWQELIESAAEYGRIVGSPGSFAIDTTPIEDYAEAWRDLMKFGPAEIAAAQDRIDTVFDHYGERIEEATRIQSEQQLLSEEDFNAWIKTLKNRRIREIRRIQTEEIDIWSADNFRRERLAEEVERNITAIQAQEEERRRQFRIRAREEMLSLKDEELKLELMRNEEAARIAAERRRISELEVEILRDNAAKSATEIQNAMRGAMVGLDLGIQDILGTKGRAINKDGDEIYAVSAGLELADLVVTGYSRGVNEELTNLNIEQVFGDRLIAAQIEAMEAEKELRDDWTVAEQNELEALYDERLIMEKEFRAAQLEIIRDFNREQRQLAFDASLDMVRSASSAAQSLYRTWESSRRRDLDNLDYTEEQKSEILEREGSKRFEAMKRVQIAEAVANTIGAGVSAFRAGMDGKWGPAAIVQASAMMASALATGYAQVKQIRALKIGSTRGSSRSYSGSFTQLNSDITARRIHNFETRQHSPSINDRTPSRDTSFNEAVAEFREVAQSLTVTLEDRTAEKANVIATKRQTRYNK